jgi:hypothetical protein
MNHFGTPVPSYGCALFAFPHTLQSGKVEAEMSHRSSFAEFKAEQARMTESWKSEGRQSEAWAVADPEIVEIFAAGISFGLKVAQRGDRDPLYTMDEWRRALREAVEKAAVLEGKIQRAQEAMQKK